MGTSFGRPFWQCLATVHWQVEVLLPPHEGNIVQPLNEADFQFHINFWEFIVQKRLQDENFLENIIWCDEAKLTKKIF